MIADDAPPSFESLQLDVHGNVALLRLNRPQRLNALSPLLMGEISAASRWLVARDVSGPASAAPRRSLAGLGPDASTPHSR